MSRTRAILHDTFGRDLGGLANAYFIPVNNTPLVMGKAGCFEECTNLHYSDACRAFYGACRRGYSHIVAALIDRVDCSNLDVEAAYRSGDLSTIAIIAAVPFGDTYRQMHLNRALWGACRGGHLELARDLLKRGAKNTGLGMIDAARGGHILLIDLMYANGGNRISATMHTAFLGGKRDVLLHLAANHSSHFTCSCGTLVADHIANMPSK